VPYLAAQSQPGNPVDLRFRAQSLARTLPYCKPANGGASGGQDQSASSTPLNAATANGPCIQLSPQANTANSQNPPSPDLTQTQIGTEGLNINPPDDSSSVPDAQLDQFGQIQPSSVAMDRRRADTLAEREAGLTTANTASSSERPTTVKLPAPEIDWDYAVIERLDKETLKTSLLPFDLGRLVMQHDQSQNLELQPGDVISVFSQADIHVPIAEQTKFVRLEGEFVHSGTYSVKPGETLRQLVERAGGLTGDAYLYGSQLTRESTRIAQQQRIDDYIQSLQLQIERGTLAQASSAVSSAQDIASANSALYTERELISKLQQIKATGRLVLEVRPDSAGIANLPDIPLEDGDRFIVPSVPASVNVVGSVYDQNAFIYRNGRRVGEYLHLAGGPNRNADRKHVFIIRADGSVLSREATSSVWGNTFDAVRLNPGDTLVVPEKTYGPSGLRGFLEFSQLFSQLAFGAAAISILQ
jgi:protein involved in polysaccharide export with SLBB domain